MKDGQEPQKKWFQGGNGSFKWSFGCSFPTAAVFTVDVDKIKKNKSSTCPNLCYDDSRCTHFIYKNGYCLLKMLKYVDTSPKFAVYDNPGGLCGFVVTRPVQYYYSIDIFSLFDCLKLFNDYFDRFILYRMW